MSMPTTPCLEALASVESDADVESDASVKSLCHLLVPASVAVVGAGRKPQSVGRAIFHNIVNGGYLGRVYPVNPHARHIEGVRCVPSVAELPEPVDLAVVAVPSEAVADVAEQCGLRGVRGLAMITAGLDSGQGADVLAACRRHGVRLIGPSSFGVAVPGIGLDATFGAGHPRPGTAGLVMQSGGLGVSLAGHLSRLGVGISSFVSLGTACDVSANDILMWWAQDQATRLAVLCVDSSGSPRKFARTARRLGRRMPVLIVDTGQPETGPRAPGDAAVTARAGRAALFKQAGIIATTGPGELLDAAALLATQPVPAGPRVAIVSNVGEAAVLAADACAAAGLVVHMVTAGTRRRLRSVVPHGGVVTGPVDTTATIAGTGFRHCLELVAADAGVDAVIVVALPTAATGDLAKAVCAAQVRVPLAAVMLDQPERVRLLRHEPGGNAQAVPAYAAPADAARALGRAAAYGAWRARPLGGGRQFPGSTTDRARALVDGFLRQAPTGGWLAPTQTAELLGCYGITPRPGGTDGAGLAVRTSQDRLFGPLVALGRGGADTGEPDGLAVRLAPLSEAEADELVREVSCALLFPGGRDGQAAGLAALRDIVLRASHLAADLPEIAELGLSPAADPLGRVVAVDARIHLAPCRVADPFLRKLR